MKKILVVVIVASFIAAFEINDIIILLELGYEVYIDSNLDACIDKVRYDSLIKLNIIVYKNKFKRNLFGLENIKVLHKLNELVMQEKYDLWYVLKINVTFLTSTRRQNTNS